MIGLGLGLTNNAVYGRRTITSYITELAAIGSQHYTIPTVTLSGNFSIPFEATTSSTQNNKYFGADSDSSTAGGLFSVDANGSVVVRSNQSWVVLGSIPIDAELHAFRLARVGPTISAYIDETLIGSYAYSGDWVIENIGRAFSSGSHTYTNGIIRNLKITDNGTLTHWYKMNETWANDTVLVNSAVSLGSDLSLGVDLSGLSLGWPADTGVVSISAEQSKLYLVTATVNQTGGDVRGIKAAIGIERDPLSTDGNVWYWLVPATSSVPLKFVTHADGFSGDISNISIRQADGYGNAINITEADADRYTQQKNGDWLGEELVVNGGFDTDTDWTKGAGWSISGGVAKALAAPSSSDLYQSTSIEQGLTYLSEFTISNYVEGSIKRQVAGVVGAVESGNGVKSEVVTAGGLSKLGIRTYPASTTLDVDNVSVKRLISKS